ncbi:MAG: class I SAM-dependent methyltransferase [Pyrinomonadaceae bacterium]
MEIAEYNSKAWDKQVEEGSEWGIPFSPEVIAAARRGEFSIILTPLKPVPRDWFPESLAGIDVLGLASGGGQQMPVLAAAGANVTSFDNSEAQLEKDKFVAKREGLSIRCEKGDAADLSRFADQSFDLIFNPCSNCYFADLEPVWKEAYRVLKPGGVLLSGFNNPITFIFDRKLDEDKKQLVVRHPLPYSDLEHLTREELAEIREKKHPTGIRPHTRVPNRRPNKSRLHNRRILRRLLVRRNLRTKQILPNVHRDKGP